MSQFTPNIQQLLQELQRTKQQKQKYLKDFNESQIQRIQLQKIIDTPNQRDKQFKEMRAALADCKFELKKQEQDNATERTKLQMNRIKELKAYEQKNHQLKEKMENDNKDWINRFDLRDTEYKEQIINLEKKFALDAQEQIRAYKQKTEAKILVIEQQKKLAVKKLQQDINTIRQEFKIQKQQFVKQSQIKLNQQLKVVNEKTTHEIIKKQKQYESKLSMVENERRNEMNQHQKTKKQLGSVKQTLYEQIYKLTNYKDDLEVRVKQFRDQIEQKTQKIMNLNNSIKQLEAKHENQINSFMDNSKKNLESIQNKSSGDIEQILRNQLLYVETMEHKIQSLEAKHKSQMNQYKNQLIQIRQAYDQRPSKNHDVQIIRDLKEKLRKKQQDYQYLQDELKWFKLEVNNKEDMYTKMFAGGFTTDLRSNANTNHTNQSNQRPVTRSSALNSRGGGGEYKPRRIGRSLMLKRRGDESRTEHGSVLQTKNYLN